MKTILIRGATQECEKAKLVLEESHIEFSEVISITSHSIPTLIVNGSAFSYKGLSGIKAYALSYRKQNGLGKSTH